MKKNTRIAVDLGEFYEDLLRVDAAINARPVATQAASLLCAKLQEREAVITKRLAYLADKRGVTPEQLWSDILAGRYTKPSPKDMEDPQP